MFSERAALTVLFLGSREHSGMHGWREGAHKDGAWQEQRRSYSRPRAGRVAAGASKETVLNLAATFLPD